MNSSRASTTARPLLSAALLLLAACGAPLTSTPVPLAGFAERTLQFALVDVHSLERQEVPGSHRFTVSFAAAPGGSCLQLEGEVSATFNGLPMQLVRGGASGAGGRASCEPTRAWYDFDPQRWANEPVEDIRLLLQDSSHSVQLVLHRAKARRRLSLQGGDERERFPRGQAYAFSWSPDSDTLLAPLQATLISPASGASTSLPVQQQALTALVSLPEATPATTFVLRLSAYAQGRVLACSGVPSCEGSLLYSEERSITVSP